MKRPKSFDVVVLGSGFAGSLIGSILTRHGLRVAIVDRGVHPRFAIGESSTPAADFLLEELCHQHGLKEVLPLSRYGSWKQAYPEVRRGCKRGFSYVWHGKGDEYRSTSDHCCELMVAASAQSSTADTQWYRPDVDQFLFNLAANEVEAIYQQTQLVSIRSQSIKPRWVLGLQSGTRVHTIHTQFVVDASGPGSFWIRSLQLDDLTSRIKTKTRAIYTHVNASCSTQDWLQSQGANCREFPYPFDLAAVHHLFTDGWMWQIGFDDNLTSLGFVVDMNRGQANVTDASDQTTWRELLLSRPALTQLYADCELAEMPGRPLLTGRLQRLLSQAAGVGWAALPFTVGFVDPLHSTGIAHTLSAVKRICDGLLLDDESSIRMAMAHYSQQLVREFLHIDQLIHGCYRSMIDFRLFTTWTMLYFAAATNFERRCRLGHYGGFLLADDDQFCGIVATCAGELEKILSSHEENAATDSDGHSSSLKQQKVEALIADCRELIQPYNHVGLFSPQQPNMYWYTAAK